MKIRISVVTCAAACFLFSSTALSQQQADSAENISISNSGEARIDSLLFVGPEDEIPPLQMPILSDEVVQEILEAPAPIQEEAPVTIEPVEGEQSVLNYGDVKRADVTIDPYRRGGKLFMRFQNNRASCTAQFVGALDVIMTAAHCVYDRRTKKWVTDVAFRRAYANGGGQAFTWRCMGIKNGWTGGNPWPWDFAFIKLTGNSTVGALGLRTGLSQVRWLSIGYPRNFEQARYMQHVKGRKGAVGGGVAEMRDNPMTFGASGGAWISGNYAIGLNSFLRGDPSQSKSLYGPVFTSQVVDLFNYVRNDCQ